MQIINKINYIIIRKINIDISYFILFLIIDLSFFKNKKVISFSISLESSLNIIKA